MSKRATITVALLLLAVVASVRCATSVSPLVRMEQGLSDSLDVTSAVVSADYDEAAPCRAQNVAVSPSCSRLEAAIPGAHKVANDLRVLYPPVLRASDAAVDVYRQALSVQAQLSSDKTATADQKAAADAAVAAALAKANAAIANLSIYVAEAQSVWGNWKGGAK